MDPKFVNLLIQQLLNTTTCPKCGSTISPINVKVESMGEDNCIFKMQCAKCKTVISADAQLNKTNPQTAKIPTKKPTEPQQMPIQKTQKPAVSLDDILIMQKQLQNFSGSFKTFFQ